MSEARGKASVVGPDGKLWIVQDETPRLRAPVPVQRPRYPGWESHLVPEGRRGGLLDAAVPEGDLLGQPMLWPEQTWLTSTPGPLYRGAEPRNTTVYSPETDADRLAESARWLRGMSGAAPAARFSEDLHLRARSPSPPWANPGAASESFFPEHPVRRHGAHERGTRTHDYENQRVADLKRHYYGNGSEPDLDFEGEWLEEPTRERKPAEEAGRAELSKDDLVVQALRDITASLRNLSAPNLAGPELEFSGDPAEDPGRFLSALERWCEQHHVPEERRGVMMGRCLQGVARKWFADVRAQEWGLVRSLFVQRWDSEALKTGLWRKLYGEPQERDERVAPFILRKWGLFQRLSPETPEQVRIASITELLVSDLRKFCRVTSARTLEELLELTIKLERDLWHEREVPGRRGPPSHAPVNEGRGRPPTRPEDSPGPSTRNRPPPPRQRAPPPREAPRPQPSAPPRREPYPCRWCGSMGHFNNQCPRRPQPTGAAVQASPSAPIPAPRGNEVRATAAAPNRR